MPAHHPPRPCFSAIAYDDDEWEITYTFTADRKDKPVPPAMAEYVYVVSFPDEPTYLDAKAAATDGSNYNANIRNAFPFVRL